MGANSDLQRSIPHSHPTKRETDAEVAEEGADDVASGLRVQQMWQGEQDSAQHSQPQNIPATPCGPLDYPAPEEQLLRGRLNGQQQQRNNQVGQEGHRVERKAVVLRTNRYRYQGWAPDQNNPDPETHGHTPQPELVDGGKQVAQFDAENKAIGNQGGKEQRHESNQCKEQIPPGGHCSQDVLSGEQCEGVHPGVGQQSKAKKAPAD